MPNTSTNTSIKVETITENQNNFMWNFSWNSVLCINWKPPGQGAKNNFFDRLQQFLTKFFRKYLYLIIYLFIYGYLTHRTALRPIIGWCHLKYWYSMQNRNTELRVMKEELTNILSCYQYGTTTWIITLNVTLILKFLGRAKK